MPTEMRVIVCLKQVPAADQLHIDPISKRLLRAGIPNEVNPYDRRALTKAVELRHRFGGEVVALTMGPPQARDALLEALAMGCDRAIHLMGSEFAGSDTLVTARVLALACRRIGFDLILCGKASTDSETAQVPPMLAEFLDLPQVLAVTRLEIADDGRRFTAVRELDDGFETVSANLPAVLSAAERLIRPIKVSPPELAAAAEKPIATWGPADIGADVASLGTQGSPTWVSSIEVIDSPRKRIVRDGRDDPFPAVQAAVADLIALELDRLPTAETALSGPGRSREESPSRAIWVVAEHSDGRVRSVTLELLGRAAELADKTGGETVAFVLGDDVEPLIAPLTAAGADRIRLAQSSSLAYYATEPYAAILAEAIQRERPFAVLLGSTDNGRDLAPRVAARLGLGLTGDCIGLEIDTQGRLLQMKPAFGGSVVAPILSRTTPAMATVRPGMLRPPRLDPSRRAKVESWETDPEPVTRVITLSVERNAGEGITLDQAPFVVGIGMGIGSPDHLPAIQAMAASIGGVLAASRKVVDAGWLPRQLQVGLTGRRIAPRLYVTLGISGNFHHLVGVRRAGVILAVNRDPEAAVFKQCDYGIIGDWAAVFPSLIQRLRAEPPSWLAARTAMPADGGRP